MEITEYIYEFVVEPSYKNYTRADFNRDGHSRKIMGEAASSKSYSDTSKSSVKRNKRYVDSPKDRSQLIYLINGPGHA